MKNQYRNTDDYVIITATSKTYGDKDFVIDYMDFDLVNNFDGIWRLEKIPNRDEFYIVASKNNKTIKLHRYILGEDNLDKDDVIDHKNGNKLDNTRKNLRIVKQKHNSQNLKNERKNSTTKIRGVSKRKDGRYSAYFMSNYTKHTLGIFCNIEEAENTVSLARAMFMPYSEDDTKKYGYMAENRQGVIYFRHGVMGAGKSAMLLKSLYIYDRMNKKYLLLTSKKDDRYDIGYITSRNGNSRKAIAISENDNIADGLKWHNYDLDYIIIDEWHLFNVKHVKELIDISLKHNITVICYGLMLDYRGEMFETTRKLLEVSSNIQQIPYECECGNLATHHLLLVDGEYKFDGNGVFIGDTEYLSVCYDCFFKKKTMG